MALVLGALESRRGSARGRAALLVAGMEQARLSAEGLYVDWLNEPRSATEILRELAAQTGSTARLERYCGLNNGVLRNAFSRNDYAFSKDTILCLRDATGIPLPALFQRHEPVSALLATERALTGARR